MPKSTGESSCKRQEDGDPSSDSERPLKKARFAWQVKGKYHLKNEINDSKNSLEVNETNRAGSSSNIESDTNDLVGSTEQNLEILGDYLLKQDFNTLDSVIADSDKSLLEPSTSKSTEKLTYPRYVSSLENGQTKRDYLSNVRSSSNEHVLSIPMSMVLKYSEDQCIARWQARQMAKGFVDNTINRVLDSWMVAPLPSNVDNRFLALDVAEFINNLPGDNSIENEGILMAISAHGLQNTSSTRDDNEDTEQSCSSSPIKHTFSSLPNSPLVSDDEPNSSNNKQSDVDSNELNMSWSCTDDAKSSDVTPFSLFPDGTSTCQYYSENDYHLPNNDYEENVNHCDFLDAAVSFAIQNKGLTSFVD